MDGFTRFVTHHSKSIVIGTFVLMALCGVLAFFVPINYDLTSYLPKDSESTVALDVMEDEFAADVPNARVMLEGVEVEQALACKEQIERAPGVESVMWLDDVADLTVPVSAMDAALVDTYYKDKNALLNVTIAPGEESQAVEAIYDIIGEQGYTTGEAVTTAETKSMAFGEVANAFAILVPLILLLLILSSTSWIEPLFFLLAIGVSIVLNMGTNIFLGEVSYIAFTIAPILQLAVSLDYAIFLLHAFHRAREVEPCAQEAMRMAMKESFSSVAASAATTTFGFAALGFMQFRIGADLGITLVKGIVFSFLCVMVFLPAFTLVARKLVDKSQHRRFMPTFANIGRGLKPLRIPVFALVILLILPCTLAQGSTLFTYGMGSSEGSPTRTARDAEAIEAVYGKETPLVILVPNASMGEEAQLVREIEAIPQVTSVLSYTTAVGAGIPAGFLDESVVSQFKSDDYTRIVAYTDMPREGDESFGVVNEIRALASSVCGEGVLVAGEPANLYDMKVVTASDSRITNVIAILAILIVLLVTFRSVLLPIVLIATIESAIMINLCVPYFTGDSLNYLGFLVINTVQLGATVDYAILFTDTYRRYRKSMPVNEALFKTCGSTFKSILVSASILALAGCVLWLTSTNNIVSILGLLLFRGTLLSLFLVVTFLPAALRIFDKLIAKTTWRADFYEPPRSAAVIDKELP